MLQDDLEEQSSQGTFNLSGRNDILTSALGTAEHPGRVRGVGGMVGFKKIFGKKTRLTVDEIQSQMDERANEIRSELRSEMLMMMEQFRSQHESAKGSCPPDIGEHESVKGSCPLHPEPFPDIPKVMKLKNKSLLLITN